MEVEKIDKKTIEKTITGIFSAISGQIDEDARKSPVFDYLMSKKEWFNDPDELNTMVIYDFKNIVEAVVKTLLGKDDWLINDIHVNYSFYDRNITELCRRFYTFVCSADRGSWIIRKAIQWRLSGDLPIFTKNEKSFWEPKTGTPEQWMNFVEGLGRLRNGKPEMYLKSYMELVSENSNNPEKA